MVLIATLLISGLVNIITIVMLGTWRCPESPIQAKDVHDVHTHSSVGLITIDESQGDRDECTCPNLAWTALEILTLTALVIFSISLAWRFGAYSLGQLRQRTQQNKRVRMEKLRAEMLETEKRAERESHIQSMRMISQGPEKLDPPVTDPGYALRP